MGCINSSGQFSHWFGNIHLSGPCNRSCYFCIGQHMMALDPLNNLDTWPFRGWEQFLNKCRDKNVRDINLTGSNTDPLLYKHHYELTSRLRQEIEKVRIGIRSNGGLALKQPEVWKLYDKASISITSLNPQIYKKTMGSGRPPDVQKIMALKPEMPLKINIVLCPETMSGDVYRTMDNLSKLGIRTINLREPYGQPHLGSPLKDHSGERLGMPIYNYKGMDVTYWDVHYVEVESVNLYANGVVSETYPVTKGHSPTGQVLGQENWLKSGRVVKQWTH